MDATLEQILTRLFSVTQELIQAQGQIRQLQADYTDIKNQLEAHDAVANTVR